MTTAPTADRKISIPATRTFTFSGTNTECSYNVTAIKEEGFKNSTHLTGITIPSNVTTIGANAFSGCSNLATVTIGANVTSIPSTVFTDCPLKSVTWNAVNCSDFASESASPFYNQRTSITSFSLSSSIQHIPSYLCYQMTGISGTKTFYSSLQSIGAYAFYGCTGLTGFNLNSATKLSSIGQRAFQNCRALSSITIPASLTSIGASAFYDTGLTSVTWNATNYTADFTSSPFSYVNMVNYTSHPEKITSFTFGNGVTRIPNYLCANLSGLTSVTIPSNVAEIGTSAFSGCTALNTVVIQRISSLTIGNGAFGTCSSLSSVKYAGTVDQWCGITFGNSTSNPTYYANGLKLNNSNAVSTEVSISASTIGQYAFEKNTSLTSVILSSDVATFNKSAFDGCTELTSVRFNGTLAQWCDNTFANATANPLDYAHHFYLNSATKLTNLEIPEAISSISDFAFYNGSGFESISVYSSTTWGANTFYGCVTPTILGDVIGTCGEHLTWRLNGNTLYIEGYGGMDDYENNTSMPWYPYRAQIQNVEFVDEATSVGNHAFNGLTNIQSVSFGSGLTSIGTKAFYGCNGITGTLTFGSDLATIGSESFENCTGITDVVLNDGLTTLEYKAFYGCSNLESITVPSTLETSNGYVFSSCSKLSSVYYAGSVDDWCAINFVSSYTSNPANNTIAKLYVDGNTETYLTEARITASTIGNYAFYNNKELTSVIITSAGSVGTDAFQNCSNLARLEVDPVDPPTTANNNVFWGVTKTIPFYIPAAGADDYEEAARWSDFTNRYLFGSCGADLTFVFEESTGILTISGSGAMTAFGSAGAVPWYSFRSDIKAIMIEGGVTTIGNYAFYGCNNEFFTSISIPQGVTSIGNSAFQGCTHITSVALPSTLRTIGSNAFHSNAFNSIIIPEGVTTISSAFPNCASLTSITIPSTVRSLANNTFNGCALLETITWNADTCADYTKSSNDGKTFTYNTPWGDAKSHISTFNFGSNVRSIPTNLCQGMTLLTSVTLPESLKTIRQDAFFGCTGLTTITIPANVKTIQGTVFDGCTSLTTVTTNAATPPTIQSTTFPSSVESAATLYVPATVAARTAYSEDTYWGEFAHILPYLLSFNMNGYGETIDPICVNAGRVDEALQPADPTEDYYTFGGWYTNETCTAPFTFGESGTVVNSDITLYAKWTENIFSFADTDTDNSNIAAAVGKKASSVTIGRTVWKDGYYNTLCLPFSLSANEIATSPLAGYKALKRLSTATVTGTGENRVLNIQLEPITAITAGEPFLISYEAGGNITNPVFNNVTVTAATPGSIHAGDVTCHGIYARTNLGDANTNLFLGTNNTLYWPQDAEHSTMNGLRAYFSIDSFGPAYAGMRVRLTDKPAETPTGIDHDAPSTEPQSTKILRDGVLLILRDGKIYSVQGVRIQ